METRCKASAFPQWLGSLRLPHFPQPRRQNYLQTINQGVGPFYSIGVGPFYVVKGWRGITGQRAGAVTDAPGARSAVWPRSLRRSPPEQVPATGKWRDTTRRGGSRARQSEQRKTGGSHRPLRGREQSRQEPLGSCTDSWVRTIISNPSEARRLQSVGGSNSTRGRVLILPLCFWRIIRSGGRES